MTEQDEAAMTPDGFADTVGVLVGWDSAVIGDCVHLKLQYFEPPGRVEGEDPKIIRLLLNQNEATVLGNYLFQITNQTPPDSPRRGFWNRLLGK